MDKYLEQHFKGTYRIRAELDSITKEFIKEDEFADFYIKAKNGKLKHGIQDELVYYGDSKQVSANILKAVYKKLSGKEWDKKDDGYYTNLCAELIRYGDIVDAELLDNEGILIFKSSLLKEIKSILKLETNGKNIAPFSVKNLPSRKTQIKLNEEWELKYKDAIKDFKLPDINKMNKDFLNKNNIENPNKLKIKELVEELDIWDSYIEFIKDWSGTNGNQNA